VTRLRALLVDVGGTLVDDATWAPPDLHTAIRTERMRTLFGAVHPWFEAFGTHPFAEADGTTYEQRTAEEVADFLRGRGVKATADEVERICRANAVPLADVVRVEPCAREALESARALGLRLAICSNTLWRNDDDCRRDWEELGFGHLFDAYVTSNSVGYGKPHPAIFERCLTALNARPEEAAMLGDRPERDIAGAKAFGMRSIWKRPHDFDGSPRPEPTTEISCLLELPPLLERWVSA
jgi:HAD superfamily hydrolase (TIGR01509 family)